MSIGRVKANNKSAETERQTEKERKRFPSDDSKALFCLQTIYSYTSSHTRTYTMPNLVVFELRTKAAKRAAVRERKFKMVCLQTIVENIRYRKQHCVSKESFSERPRIGNEIDRADCIELLKIKLNKS